MSFGILSYDTSQTHFIHVFMYIHIYLIAFMLTIVLFEVGNRIKYDYSLKF